MKETLEIWWRELRYMLTDEGMLLFLVLLPLAYPIAYSWIYNNEVVREVPVVVVDRSHSAASRLFASRFDASPNVRVAFRAADFDEAERIIAAGKAYGTLYFPADFGRRLARGEQATVGVYCDMQLMLAYKNIYQTATAVAQSPTAHPEGGVGLSPWAGSPRSGGGVAITSDDVPLFNTTMGYGNFIIPGVLVLILQQTMLLAMGLANGTRRESPHAPTSGAFRLVTGRAGAYVLLYCVLAAYMLLVVPHIFGFASLVRGADLALLALPYILACTFFAMTVMSMVRRREDVLLLVVFTSVPLLFLAGVSWPLSNIPKVWQWVAMLFPSTYGIRGFIAQSTMGASLTDTMPQVTALWIQAVVYFVTSNALYLIHNNAIRSDFNRHPRGDESPRESAPGDTAQHQESVS